MNKKQVNRLGLKDEETPEQDYDALDIVEFEEFIFPANITQIQGCYHIPAKEVDGEKTEASTVVHLVGWVCPILRVDPDKKFYYFLRKILKPRKIES